MKGWPKKRSATRKSRKLISSLTKWKKFHRLPRQKSKNVSKRSESTFSDD